MSKAINNPYRENSYNHKILGVLLKSKKALSLVEVAKRANLAQSRARRVLAALANPRHASRGIRVGILVESVDGTYAVRQVTPDPNARRPEKKGK